jgi:exopolysaccharide production protein ExoZ
MQSPQDRAAPTQLRSLQVLRAVAAWGVVLHHYYLHARAPWAELFRDYGNFGVDIFFVLSGFLMFYTVRHSNTSATQFWLSRLLRIAPPYWFATLLTVALRELFPLQFGYTDWTPRTLLASLFFIPTDNPTGRGIFPVLPAGWTLNLEVFFYGLLAACFPLKGYARFIACGLALVIAPFLWPRDLPLGSVLADQRLFEFALGLCVGYAYDWSSAWRQRFGSPWWQMPLGLAGSVGLLAAGFHGSRFLAATGLVASAAVAERQAFRPEWRWVRAAARLGTISYSTYLFHTLVLGLLAAFASAIAQPWMLNTSPLFLVVLVWGASELGYRTVEDHPWLRRARSWLRARERATAVAAPNPVVTAPSQTVTATVTTAPATVNAPSLNVPVGIAQPPLVPPGLELTVAPANDVAPEAVAAGSTRGGRVRTETRDSTRQG